MFLLPQYIFRLPNKAIVGGLATTLLATSFLGKVLLDLHEQNHPQPLLYSEDSLDPPIPMPNGDFGRVQSADPANEPQVTLKPLQDSLLFSPSNSDTVQSSSNNSDSENEPQEFLGWHWHGCDVAPGGGTEWCKSAEASFF